MNRLERAILEHRAAIRSIDRAALANVLNTYEEIMARLNPQIEVLVQTLRTKGELTPSELFRLDRYQELQRQIAEEMRTLATATGDITAQAQARAIQEAVTSAENMAVSAARGTSATATVATSWVNVPTKAVEDFIGASRSGPLADLLASFEEVTGRELVNQITNALATGTNPRAVADAITKSTEIGRNRALTIARTEMMRSSRSATLAQYEENADILQGWIWSCAKSDNTCAACLAMDGTTHPQGETMDSHVNCRCSPIPWLKDIPMRPTESGAQWLEKQDAETQDRILGKAGGEAYRAGEVKLDDFVKITNSQDWGKSISDGGVGFARMNASRRSDIDRFVAPKAEPAMAFQPAKTIDEAVIYSKSLGVESADYGKNLHIANMANEAMTGHVSRGYRVPANVRTKTIAGEGNLGPRNPAAYFPENDSLVLNPSSGYWRNPETFTAQQSKMGFWSSDERLQVVTHELGHVAHSDILGAGEFRNASRRFLFPELAGTKDAAPLVREVTGTVSRYALNNEVEFVAEVYAGKVSGKTYSDVIEELYKRYKGPDVKASDVATRKVS